MNKEQIPKELEQTLKKLCEHLNLFLSKTKTSLDIAENRFEQVFFVLQSWNLSKESILDDYDETTCICDSLKTDAPTTDHTAGNSLLNSISKTLSTAQSLLPKNATSGKVSTDIIKKSSKDSTDIIKKSSKVSTDSGKKFSKVSKTSSTCVSQKLSKTSKTKQTLSTKSSTSQSMNTSKDGVSSHNPSCPLFNVDISSSKLSNLSLSDAITITKIPSSLSHTIKYCSNFLENYEKDTKEIKGKAKLNFLHLLETQNKNSCAKFEAQYSPSEIFMKYLSALHSYRNKQNDSKTVWNWIYYTDIKDMESFQMNRTKIITTELWNLILSFIIDNVIPVLKTSNLSIMEKLYIQKLMKTICNFTQSPVPRIPIFKIHQRDD